MVEDSASTECVFPPPGRDTPPSCSHDSVQQLGMDAGQNEYLRCRDCESVIVTFRPSDDWEDRREELTMDSQDGNPILDALRSNNPDNESSNRGNGGLADDSFTDRLRDTWRRFLGK